MAFRLRAGSVIVILLALMTPLACGGGHGGGMHGGGTQAPRPTGAQADDRVLAEGRDVYVANCARCHGSQGQGKTGPDLAEDPPDIDTGIDAVKEGPGSMPGFKGDLSSGETRAVVRYVREVL
jgi:mono/diheme cytochrome c family protein